MPTRFDTKRTPSSSSTNATIRGVASGSVGWCDRIHVYTEPRPDASCVSHSTEAHLVDAGALVDLQLLDDLVGVAAEHHPAVDQRVEQLGWERPRRLRPRGRTLSVREHVVVELHEGHDVAAVRVECQLARLVAV